MTIQNLFDILLSLGIDNSGEISAIGFMQKLTTLRPVDVRKVFMKLEIDKDNKSEMEYYIYCQDDLNKDQMLKKIEDFVKNSVVSSPVVSNDDFNNLLSNQSDSFGNDITSSKVGMKSNFEPYNNDNINNPNRYSFEDNNNPNSYPFEDNNNSNKYSFGDNNNPNSYPFENNDNPNRYSFGDNNNPNSYPFENNDNSNRYSFGDNNNPNSYPFENNDNPNRYSFGDNNNPNGYSFEDSNNVNEFSHKDDINQNSTYEDNSNQIGNSYVNQSTYDNNQFNGWENFNMEEPPRFQKNDDPFGEYTEVSGNNPFNFSENSKVTAITDDSCHATFDIINRLLPKILSNDLTAIPNDIKVRDFTAIKGMSIDTSSKATINIKNFDVIYGNLVILLNNQNELFAVGKIENSVDDKYLVFDVDNIDYSAFKHHRIFNLLIFQKDVAEIFNAVNISELVENGNINAMKFIHYTISCLINIEKEAPIVDETLCIDFGSSNTSVATYGRNKIDYNEINLVKFFNPVNGEESFTIPTIVYIENCQNDGNKEDIAKIKYRFGYEAQKTIINLDYSSRATVFYEIKRWMSDINRTEIITDNYGNVFDDVPRAVIIRNFLLYVIKEAENFFKVRFKNVHFSSPVKLKSEYIKIMQENIFKDTNYRVVDVNNSIDEGFSILYYAITQKANKYNNVLILDAGGGTTDVVSCKYQYKPVMNAMAKKLEITSKFQSGNSNFGGNNITYRILQMLKIKMYNYYYKKSLKANVEIGDEEILKIMDNNIENNVSNITKGVYEDFENNYMIAEEFIPTMFSDKKRFIYDNDIKKVKRNFFYLWYIAEGIKKSIFSDTFQSELKFTQDFSSQNTISRYIGNNKPFSLYIKDINTNEYIEREGIPEMSFSNKDVSHLLYGDCYYILNTVLVLNSTDDDETKIHNYDYYKISGQTSQISTIHDLLKEFIPGKKLRTLSLGNGAYYSQNLKLECVMGSVAYARDINNGALRPSITIIPPDVLNYNININFGYQTITILDHNYKVSVFPYSNTATHQILEIVDSKTKEKIVTLPLCLHPKVSNRIGRTLDGIIREIAQRSSDKIDFENLYQTLNTLDVDMDYNHFLIVTPCKENPFAINIFEIEKMGNQFNWLAYDTKSIDNKNAMLKTFFDGKK